MTLFPGMDVTSTFFDGQVVGYTPSLPELGLGIGGVGLALLIMVIGIRILPFLPEHLETGPLGANTDYGTGTDSTA